MTTTTFQFHNIASSKIECDHKLTQEFFNSEYIYHQVDSTSNELPCVFLNFRVNSEAPPAFTRHTHKLLAHWAYDIRLAEDGIKIHSYGNSMAVPMVHHMLVHPSMRWLAANQKTLLLHAGAVAKNGRSLIFTGKGGAGKTTTTSLILASNTGWQIHADDYVFLRPQPKSLAYVTRSHLYRDLFKWVPELKKRLTTWERVRMEFFGALRQYSQERIKWPVRLPPKRLWPNVEIANTANPAAILLLERAEVTKTQLIPIDKLSLAASDLLEMNFSEARHFLALTQKSGFLEQNWLESWKAMESKLIHTILEQIPTYRLVLPYSQSKSQLKSELLPILEKLV